MLTNERNLRTHQEINQLLRKRQLDSESASQTDIMQNDSIHSRLPNHENYHFLLKPFPRILREILSDQRNGGCIGWTTDGSSLRILDRKNFIEQVLPRYFGNKCDLTFTRNLIRWNFRPVTFGPNEGAWCNPHFVRNDNYVPDDNNKREKIKVRTPRNDNLSRNLRKFPRSKKPLKKRPVDASLFLGDVNEKTTKNVPQMRFLPLINQQRDHIAFGNIPSYTFGSSRPPALADTQSVIQAAMKALIQSHAHSSSSIQNDISTLVKQSNSNSPHPFREQLIEAQARIKFGYNPRASFF